MAHGIDIEKIDLNNQELQNALQLVQFTHRSLFLTGKAGTGKSTFLHYIAQTTKRNMLFSPLLALQQSMSVGLHYIASSNFPFIPYFLTTDATARSSLEIRSSITARKSNSSVNSNLSSLMRFLWFVPTSLISSTKY